MYIYNITYSIENKVKDKWLEWVENEFAPMMKKEGFTKINLLKIDVDDKDNATYCLHLQTNNKQLITDFNEKEPKYRFDLYTLFKEQVVNFSTKLEIIKGF